MFRIADYICTGKRALLVLLWLAVWPLSELAGRPYEVEEPLPRHELTYMVIISIIGVSSFSILALLLE